MSELPAVPAAPQNRVAILGLGYVGLPLALEASRRGWQVTGFDPAEPVVKGLAAGHSHVEDVSDDDVRAILAAGFSPTAEPSALKDAAVIVICVPTPLGDDGAPDLSAVRSAATTVAEQLTSGTLVILESTSYPGTTDSVVLPILEKVSGLVHGVDFQLAFSPERVNPGDPVYGIANTPKLVGGLNDEATRATTDFYATFIADVVPLKGAREAETAKLLENTYRHVNIALVNEMAILCHELGIDIWEVIRGAATKPFGFEAFRPGPGVGGHCIPIDPNYLGYEVRRTLGRDFRFVQLAEDINRGMPSYVVSRINQLLDDALKPLRGSRVLLLGVSYKPNVADLRESPAFPIAEILLSKGAEVSYFDPFVSSWQLESGVVIDRASELFAAAAEADVTVLLQAHKAFDLDAIALAAKIFFDTSGKASAEAATKL